MPIEDVHIFYHNCDGKAVEVHGHLQCSVCGRVTESCCEGSPTAEKGEVKWYKAPSKIHGAGAFAAKDIKKGEMIDQIAIYSKGDWFGITRTDLGMLVNHQRKSNCELQKEDDDQGFRLYALGAIDKGEELVADYSKVPFPFRRDTYGLLELEE